MAAILASVGLVVLGPAGTAQAADDYPWSGAATVPGGTYQWGYTTCPDNDKSCMILNDLGTDGKKYGEADPWGYYFRNCTSWVAWKLSGQSFDASGYGNASSWGSRAKAKGYTVDMSPAVGAVAWYDSNAFGMSSFGHVAWVSAVSSDGSSVTVEEYNNPADGNWHSRTFAASRVSGYIHFADITGSSGGGSGGSSPPPIPQIIALKRTADPNGVRQVYAATNTAVTEGWWIPGGDGVHTHEIINIAQHNIVGFDKVDLPDGTQAVYTAVSDGVWETWWKPDGTTGTDKIVTGLSGVKGVTAYNDTESGAFVHHLYILAGDGPYEAWWKDGGDGVHLSLLVGISGGVTFTQSIAPDGSMQLYVATPTWVYEVWWVIGSGVIHSDTIINITQGDIRSLSKGDNLSDGTQLLYTGTSTTAWQSAWGGSVVGISDGTIATGQVNAIQVKKTVTNGVHQLYLATTNHVQEYWWNGPSSGGGTLINISQNNIGAIDKVDDGASQELYTGAGNWVYETWWSSSSSPSTSGLFSVAD